MHPFSEPVRIAASDIGDGLLHIEIGDAKGAKARRAHQIGRLHRLANLVIDTGLDQFSPPSDR